ncbi:aldolase [Pseudomonas agarici]|uniref:Aldolase n=1 Tax=Pseudomonas agarici TaxID=46677 RepID=A0A0X1SZ21_PSEAA|nr:class II aldolase/adducin family protein [Pseudomonas agarici]AMB85088.1 aldolase [Pseudomonas agarici]NWB91421.1 class II aldolase/adducin family protein [Pseudomonas agarici]NWC07831.1 class II aldolase/adducin family protein [Pseudomonas agarici]SEK75601.1 L-fuculose-phosphate aldolase [Pseudomonas agarici]
MSDLVYTEPELRRQLANGIRILERLGIIDFNGHFSARLSDGRILINSGDSVRSAISESDFTIVGPNGEFLAGQARPPAELPLHVSIYQARPDVQVIAHGHPKWSTLLTSAGHPYRVVLAQGALVGDVPIFPSPVSVNKPAVGDAVARALGNAEAVLLKAHGSVLVAKDVLEATVMAIYMELNAERQVLAMPLGGGYIFSAQEADACRAGLAKRGLYEKCWNYHMEKFALTGVD